MNLSDDRRFDDVVPAESRLIRQARAGNVDAFARLYDSAVERVYRYVYFRVPGESIANGITFQVFFRAWEQFDRYPLIGTAFIDWLYALAQTQITEYFQTHKNGISKNRLSLTFRSQAFQEETQGLFDLQTLRDGMQVLDGEEQQALALKFILKLSDHSVAQLMGRSQREIAGLQTRALQTLAGYLKEKELA